MEYHTRECRCPEVAEGMRVCYGADVVMQKRSENVYLERILFRCYCQREPITSLILRAVQGNLMCLPELFHTLKRNDQPNVTRLFMSETYHGVRYLFMTEQELLEDYESFQKLIKDVSEMILYTIEEDLYYKCMGWCSSDEWPVRFYNLWSNFLVRCKYPSLQ